VDIDEDSWISKPVVEKAPGNINSMQSSTSLISSALSASAADRDVDDVASVASVYTESGKVPGAARESLNRTERMWRSIDLNRKTRSRRYAKGDERVQDENLSGNSSPIEGLSSGEEVLHAAKKDRRDAGRAPSPLSRKEQVPKSTADLNLRPPILTLVLTASSLSSSPRLVF
jgi:hypothetical protein